MYKLFYNPGMASLAPHIALEEIGADYELVRVDTAAGEHRTAAYLALNPTGRIPTLLEGGQPVFETAAILLYLADRHPEAGLIPAVGTMERGLACQWLVHLANTVHPAFVCFYYPERHVADPANVADVKATAEQRLNLMFDLLDAELEKRNWLGGDAYGVADIFLFMMVRWGRNFQHRPPRLLPNLGAHAARMMSRPAVRRAFEREGLAEPYF
ncbi:glutathione S-transferase family protein [Indioceanicola profundi]|uniref:glutathione S-transferase family protein n=1 Tax=Indioceanicola profundi TaxID=2220096 RepID=UPI000E6AA0F1|nr:glutathione binding-like protein [Indioceanicola profundi]